jgi:membrane-associated protein
VHLDATTLAQWFAAYGYPALALLVTLAAAGAPLPFPVAAAFVALGALTATPHGPSFVALLVVALLAATIGHSVDYWLGRAGSPLLRGGLARLERRTGWASPARAERGFAHNGGALILLTRFLLTPIASPVSALAGATRFPYVRYLALEALGQLIYFAGYLGLGRALGPTLVHSGPTTVLFFGVIALVAIAPILLLRLRPGLLRRLTQPSTSPAEAVDVAFATPPPASPLARRRAARPPRE